MKLNRDWIAAHIPHQGRMCLLDSVSSWDTDSIVCRSGSHRLADHPLRAHGRLGAACLVEYAAQATAVHGALLQTDAPGRPFGMLTSARAVELLIADLTGINTELDIQARRQHADARGALYAFEIGAGEQILARGRISLLLQLPAEDRQGPA